MLRIAFLIVAFVTTSSTLVGAAEQTPADAKASGDKVRPKTDEEHIASRLAAFQSNGWLGWIPGTVMVMTFLSSDPKQFNSNVQPDLKYTLGDKTLPLTRAQLVQGEITHQTLNTGLPDSGKIAVFRRGPKEIGAAKELLLDGIKVKYLQIERTYPVDLGTGPHAERTTIDWILPTQPSICLRWGTKDSYHVVTSLHSEKTIGKEKYDCVVLERRLPLATKQVTFETLYLSPEVPGFVVERITEFHRDRNGDRNGDRDRNGKKPTRTHEIVKTVTPPQ
jgi:hypothetical protein